MGGFGRQWSIIEGAGRPGPAVYGNPWYSLQAVTCTEIISFPYTPSDLDPSGPKFGLNHPQTAGIRKRVPFRTFRNLMASGGYHKNMHLHNIKLYGGI